MARRAKLVIAEVHEDLIRTGGENSIHVDEIDWFVRWCRAGVAPGASAAETRAMYRVDVRGVLSSIQVPTLVIGLSGDDFRHQNGVYISDRVVGARLLQALDLVRQALNQDFQHFHIAVGLRARLQRVGDHRIPLESPGEPYK